VGGVVDGHFRAAMRTSGTRMTAFSRDFGGTDKQFVGVTQ
jgi:hypothetical protein